ncbi:MAG: M15 family metallopeptidase [Erysipelotrichia bacterium]|nr:M15 family metallopeptidase [Erysipelotrichia bacterium]
MQEKKKITIMSIAIAILSVSLIVLIYFGFFADKHYKDLGYTNQDIKLIHQYQLENEIKDYNHSLVYALHSADFQEKNIHYYLLFNSQIDYTECINKLAQNYSLNDLKELLTVLNYDEAAELIEYEKINNISFFQQVKNKGYNTGDSVIIANSLDENSLKSFLSLPTLQKGSNFVNYLNSGYNAETIVRLFNKLGEDTFNDLSTILYFDNLDDYLSADNFDIKLLPRYLMYADKHNVSASDAVYYVNNNNDYVEDPDFAAFYENSQEVDSYSLTMLVNKSHRLKSDYVPENLIDINANYRNSAQSLNSEAADAFIKMSDDCYQATDRRILVYSGYRSYNVEESFYNEYLNASGDDNSNKVDSFANRPGYSEHQSGLAIDICQKGYSYNEFNTCISSDWVYENCYDYGYILRYPSSRAFLTGCYYTPYHYRYVGIETAQKIKKYNWTLEEYNYIFSN